MDWPRHQSVHDVQSFWGLASYYRKFIRDLSHLAKSLTDRNREEVVWRWGDTENNSIVSLRIAMATALVLHLPDFELPFVVTTDVSGVAVGAILEQYFGSGLQLVAYVRCQH